MLVVAKVGGYLAQRVGQPAVLGELMGGVLAGGSVFRLVNPEYETIHLVSELGVVILLFAIGLETDLGQLLKVGATSFTVAVVGVVLPFVLGFAVCRLTGARHLGIDHGGRDPDRHERGHHGPSALRPGATARPGRPDHPGRGRDRRHPRPDDPDGRGRAGEGREIAPLVNRPLDGDRARVLGRRDRHRQAGRSDRCFAGPVASSCPVRRPRWHWSPRLGWPGSPSSAARQ